MRIFLLSLAGTMLLVLLGLGWGFYSLFAMPGSQDVVTEVGLTAPVTVRTDGYGIPVIEAENEQSLYFTMGYLHAKDRLWQLEVQKRLSSGTLSEVFGKKTLAQDVWIRTLGIRQAAEQALSQLEPDVLASLQAYSDGINAWVAKQTKLPAEFVLLNIQPQGWQPVDSLAWSKMFALNLAGNFRQELQRMIALQLLTPEQVALFFPQDGIPLSRTARQWPNTDSLQGLLAPLTDLQQHFAVGGTNVGSNAWVVSGHLTASGAALLANDPHLGLQTPSLWYAVSQQIPNMQVSGMTLVGLPVIIFGRNADIAWGGTNMMADVQDLNIERLNPANPRQYWQDGRWTDFVTRSETIQVRADFPSALRDPLKPVVIQVRQTASGPVISDGVITVSQPMTLHWVGVDRHDTTYQAFYRLNRARNWTEFLAATAEHTAPALNMFYADTAGNIGFKGIGRIPLRESGNGTLPGEHHKAQGNWIGYIPFAELPMSYNPPEGFIVNANNANVDSTYPYVISHDFAPASRAERIRELLANSTTASTKLTIEQTRQHQSDTVDLSAKKLFRQLIRHQTGTADLQNVITQLQHWDLRADQQSVGASIYYTWLYYLRTQLFNDELKGYWQKKGSESTLTAMSALVTADSIASWLQQESAWCDDVNTAAVENCHAVVTTSLQLAVEDLRRHLGSDMAAWRWGAQQRSVFRHTPFSDVKGLNQLFELTTEAAGAPDTVQATAATYQDNDGFTATFGVGFRQIMQMSKETPVHLLINSTGQSGQMMSPHFSDMLQLFQQQQYVDLNKKQSVTVLQLLPAAQEH
ncbi:hypothetical protein A5320_03940 [Rheinheimera sp. SA_1]|uniref:penicillin acylase family protein n=1 Tax=Rheinheimera sp. SA_1 TaxID=1827365 RepID=UPI0007FBA32F|nr:penicillin acylase family protein [Rheinheimera sp. SA_1]OBP16557.1 hypothetical protein A5320_03940 [Rheinheimera sp. SA_1]